MDQTNPEKQDHEWSELNKNKKILADDIIKELSQYAKQPYPHQFEFLQYLLGEDIKQQQPLIALRSQTGSGKTLCFQAIIYQNYDVKIHSQINEVRTIKSNQKTCLTPYSIVLGNTIFLKQHEEVFRKSLPERLKNEGLKFQTFFALGKGADKQFDTPENRIENAQAQVLLCHPSKIMAAIKQGIFLCKNLRYLIIDEADDLLKDDPNNLAKRDVSSILSFVMGQKGENLKFQIIFVSASLKTEQIQEIVYDSIKYLFENEKSIDKRFYIQNGDSKEPNVELKVIPSQISSIVPYQIRHFYYEPSQKKQRKNFLVKLIARVYEQFDSIQVMIFFNTKIGSKKIFKEFESNAQLKFLVDKQHFAICTGETNQIDRESVRKDFKDEKKKILLCTDVLQRGLDFRKVRLIVHYGLPRDPQGKFQPEIYFQRSGRTGRAQDEGAVITLLGQKDKQDRKIQFVKELTDVKCKIQEYNEDTFLEDVNKVLSFNAEQQ